MLSLGRRPGAELRRVESCAANQMKIRRMSDLCSRAPMMKKMNLVEFDRCRSVETEVHN